MTIQKFLKYKFEKTKKFKLFRVVAYLVYLISICVLPQLEVNESVEFIVIASWVFLFIAQEVVQVCGQVEMGTLSDYVDLWNMLDFAIISL